MIFYVIPIIFHYSLVVKIRNAWIGYYSVNADRQHVLLEKSVETKDFKREIILNYELHELIPEV